MGRQKRTDYVGAWHHVMNRGARRQVIFHDDVDREMFLKVLGESEERFGVEVHAYCLMGNHYHLILRCDQANLSRALHRLGSMYVRWFNRRWGYDGPMFRDRFRSILIEDDAYLAAAVNYVHDNPAEMGADIDDYAWSSLGAYVGRRHSPRWLRRSRLHHAVAAHCARTRRTPTAAGGGWPAPVWAPPGTARPEPREPRGP